MLEHKPNRQIIEQVRDDTTSLVVLCDTSSRNSRVTESTETSSRLSTIFQFDAELIGSRVYQRAVHQLFKRTVHQGKYLDETAKQSDFFAIKKTERLEERLQSKTIDRLLRKEREKMLTELKVLVSGAEDSGVHTLWYQLRSSTSEFRSEVFSMIVLEMQTLLNSATWTWENEAHQKQADFVLQQNHPVYQLTAYLTVALDTLWRKASVEDKHLHDLVSESSCS